MSSQFNLIYMAQYHTFPLRGFTICRSHDLDKEKILQRGEKMEETRKSKWGGILYLDGGGYLAIPGIKQIGL